MLTQSLSLFDVGTKATVTTGKRLMTDIKDAQNSYCRNEIENIGFIRSEYIPADAWTKRTPKCILKNILSSSPLVRSVYKWIQRQ